MITIDRKEPAVRICAWYEDFDGNIEDWRDAFYNVWRWQLTYDFAYRIDLRESRRKGVFVDLLIRPAYKQQVIETMDDLGYKNINTESVHVGIVYGYETPEVEDIEELVIDY